MDCCKAVEEQLTQTSAELKSKGSCSIGNYVIARQTRSKKAMFTIAAIAI